MLRLCVKWDQMGCLPMRKIAQKWPPFCRKTFYSTPIREEKTTSLLSIIYVKIKGVWKIHRTTQVSDAEFTHSARQPILLKGKSALPPNHWWRKSYLEFLTPQLNGSCERKQTVRCFFFWSSFFLSFSSVTRLYGIIRLYRPCRSAPLIYFFCRQ